jgi:hypothetical protein
MYMPDLNFRPVPREEYLSFAGADPWENNDHTTWFLKGYQMETASVKPPYPPGTNANQAVFVGIETRDHGRYRILPMALQDLWREGVLRGPELPALLHATEGKLTISDYPPPFMDLYLRLLSITFAAFALLSTGVAVWTKINDPYYFYDVLPAVIFFCVAALLPTGILIRQRIRRRRLTSQYRTLVTGNMSSASA